MSERLTRIGYALSHSLRIEILKALMREESSANRLSKELGVPVANAAYHLCRVLYDRCDLVEITARHQRRGATEKVFALKRGPAVGLLATAIAALEAELGEGEPEGANGWQPVAADGRGEREIVEAMDEFQRRVAAVQQRVAAERPEQVRQLIVSRSVLEISDRPRR